MSPLYNFYFFNQDQRLSKEKMVYEPLKIVLRDKAEILDFIMCSRLSRPVSGIKLVRDTAGNSLSINFKALEKDDGMVGQIIF